MNHFEPLDARWLFADFTATTATEFQNLLNSVQLGDNIILAVGPNVAPFKGQFTLPKKTTGTGWITIKSQNLHLLPAEGVRVSPADAVNMPRIQAPGSNVSALKTAAGAHHYKLVGIEFVGPDNNSDVTALVELGTSSSSQSTYDTVPHHIVMDRVYMRPNVNTAQIRRAIALNSAFTDITNSYIEEIHQQGSDSQAIAGWNGPGPFNIINNHLEAASENIMFGGDTTRLTGYVASDVVIRGNHLIKPLDWRLGTNGSNKWTVKNLFELKHGKNFLVEGNIMENNWVSGQSGVAIVLKLGNWGTSQWNVTENITLRNNIIRNSAGAVTLQGRDYSEGSPPGLVKDLKFINNLFYNIDRSWTTNGTGIGGNFLYMTQGPLNAVFDHNTIFNGRTISDVDTPEYPTTGFRFTNNITMHNAYGVRSTLGTGNPTFQAYFNEGTTAEAQARFTKNVINLQNGGSASNYSSRPGNFFPANWSTVQFVDQANGDYRLAPTSPYKNAGTDGKDVGANMDEIALATAGAISGTWPQALQGIAINDGAAQRSKVTKVTLSFNQPINAVGGAISLSRRDGTSVEVVATPSADKKTYTLTFSGAGISAGSLADGVYDFLADVSEFKDAFDMMPVGTLVDQDQTRTFHRLFGDFDGNRTVNNFDYSRFNSSFGKTSSDPGYLWFFDFDGNTIVNNFDYAQFKTRYGTVLSY
jgi:hypothetical protein